MFGAITPAYDRLNHLLSGSLDKRWRRRAARETLAGLTPCGRLLDVATGTGDLAWTLRQTAAGMKGTEAVEVTGADFTFPMLQRASEKYPQGGMSWAEADGLNLPFADNAFDAATIAFGLRNMADKRRGLAEMARVVRPGGRVAILEFSQPPNRLFRGLYDFYSFSVMPRVGAWISGSDAYYYLARSIRGFWSPEQLSEEMERVGLRPMKATGLMMGVVYLHLGEKQANASGKESG